MTAKEKIIKLIDNRISEIEMSPVLYSGLKFKHELTELQKLKKIVENLNSDYENEAEKISYAYERGGFIDGSEHILNKLNTEL
jgi:hypothetical protein